MLTKQRVFFGGTPDIRDSFSRIIVSPLLNELRKSLNVILNHHLPRAGTYENSMPQQGPRNHFGMQRHYNNDNCR